MAQAYSARQRPGSMSSIRNKNRPPAERARFQANKAANADGNTKDAPDYSIAAVNRALDLLEALARVGPAPLAVLAETAGCTRTAGFRLLRTLQARYHLAYLFISHDLAVVRAISHDVIVMRAGKVVEQGPVERVFAAPKQPYTQALLAAALGLEPVAVDPA